MKRFFSIAFMLTVLAAAAWAQKTVYIPNEWRNPWPSDSLLYKESDPDNKYTWSKSRSVESDNVIVFWDKGYGSTRPSASPSAYRVDEQDLLQKCEEFFDLEINQLGFVDPVSSNLGKYKVMVLLNHTTDWVCYGGGYDFMVSALWLGPSACKPVGHSVAHEVGHSFHYMCFAEHSGHRDSQTDGTGFHLPVGNGQAIWEQTAQWQANQSYPGLMYDQSIGMFRNTHNYAFSHEWHRYQSYWFHYFLCQYYDDIQTVAKVWNQPMTGAVDFNQSLMSLKGLSAQELYKLYFDYACRCATWDMEACRPYRDPYIGDFDYRCVLTEDTSYQVALASCPQGTGFNVIPLQVPAAGTRVTTHLTGLSVGAPLHDNDPGEYLNGDSQWAKVTNRRYITNSQRSNRGFRMGYVALMQDGSRQYFSEDSVYCKGTSVVTEDYAFTVPEGVSRLWLIVSPALKSYVQHKWDEKFENDDMWPYKVKFEGTDIGTRALVYAAPTLDGRTIGDVTLTYDVTFPFDAQGYSGTVVNVSGLAAATLGTAFQLEPSAIGSKLQAWSAQGPANNRIMFYAVNPDGSLASRGSTANGYGHWFNASGMVCDYASGYVFSEFTPSSLRFTVGQFPGRCTEGQTYTISQALRYRKSASVQATATFIFHLTVGPVASVALKSIDYDDPTLSIESVSTSSDNTSSAVYDLEGRRTNHPEKGIYLKNGRKFIAK